MTEVYLGLGSNLGNREANLRMALRLLTRMARVEAVSSLYETAAMGGPQGQPPFYNAVARLECGLAPPALLRFLQNLEREIGRRPFSPRWGRRPVDLDILLYGDRILQGEGLELPHPRLGQRAFVQTPLAELAPDLVPPGQEQTVRELLAQVDASGVRLVAGSGWQGDLRPAERLSL